MQASIILALLATAAMTNAAPYFNTTPKAIDKPISGNICGLNQKQACCNSSNSVAVLGLECTLSSVLGGKTCNGSVQCCDVDPNGEINFVKLCAPI